MGEKCCLRWLKHIGLFISVERAELEAFKMALDLVHEHRWSPVIIEGDAQLIVEALCGKIVRGLHSQVLVHNIRHSAALLSGITFCFCFREANHVAHRLARRAVTSVCDNVWVDNGPLWISDLVFSDFSD